MPPTQVPSAPMLATSAVNETPINVAPVETDPGDGARGKGVYCTSMRCLREIQQQRMLFEPPSISLRSSITIPAVPSVSEDNEDNYEHERNEEKKIKDREAEARRLDEETKREKDSERIATMENSDSVKKTDEDISGIAEHSGERRGLTVEKSHSSAEDTRQSESRLSEERHSSPKTELSHRRNRESVASFHHMKELNSERRLIASIRSLMDSTSHHASISAPRSSYRSNEEFEGSWIRQSGFRLFAAEPSLEALDEVPAEYAPGLELDVEDVEIERLIKTQYYNQLDLPSMADDPLEAEQHDTFGAALLRDTSTSTVASQRGSLMSMAEDHVQGDGTRPPTYDAVGVWVKAIRSGSMTSDSSSSLFHPELAINWDIISSVSISSDLAEIAPQKDIKTKSRTTVVSKAPSLRAITEEHQARGGAGGRLPEKNQTQEGLRKTDSFGKRTSESFTSKI